MGDDRPDSRWHTARLSPRNDRKPAPHRVFALAYSLPVILKRL